MKKQIKEKWSSRKVIGFVLMVTLWLSIAYTVIKIATTPEEVAPGEVPRADYVLMLLQCVLGLVVMSLPSILQRRFSLDIPNYMYVAYFVFLYCAIYLGEVHRFFYRIPFWDSLLHAFSGAMLGALGFALVSMLNDAETVHIHLSPGFVALFAFCFALAAGTVWEIYEFTGDSLLGLNMQKYRLADGTLLVGQAALADTMKDLVIDAVSALVVTLVGYFTTRKRKNKTQDPSPTPAAE